MIALPDRKVILTDVDGTVLVMDSAFEQFMGQKGKPSLSRMRDHYSIALAFGITEREANEAIRDFFHHPLMGQLKPEPCAAVVLPELRRAGWRFVAITACPHEGDIVARRRANLEAVFGFEWDAIHCVGFNTEKLSALLAYRPTVWVEDHFSNAVAGAKAGHRSFLLNRPYNNAWTHTKVSKVADWYAIAAQIG